MSAPRFRHMIALACLVLALCLPCREPLRRRRTHRGGPMRRSRRTDRPFEGLVLGGVLVALIRSRSGSPLAAAAYHGVVPLPGPAYLALTAVTTTSVDEASG